MNGDIEKTTVPVPSVGPIEPAWPGVRKIAVLRGGGLGDLLFAMPAIHALAAAYPDAELVLLGTPLHAALLHDRPGPVSRVSTLPVATGVHEPKDRAPDESEQERFFREVAREPVDLAVQLHGGGRWSNAFLHRLDPTWTVGARTEDAAPMSRWLPYRFYQQEMMRALEIVGLAGAPPVYLEPRIALTQADLDVAAESLRGLPEPLLAVHPGATDPRRQWPPERFAEVAAKCAEEGASVVVLGAPDERELVAEVTELTRQRLPGTAAEAVRGHADLSLSALCGVLARSAVLIGNDSGPRHLAKALGTPTVGIFWMGNVINAGPLGRLHDRVLIAWTATCPICGVDCTREDLPRCAHNVSFVDTVSTEDALREVVELIG
ncbi:ADP-heptose:LPS heptosyltransferase [Amycolatopsis marina]|uniref:ADP-heptose:LPS heptosyltransferase n=1 Tax=Amycolatopsis marina TaxID=490629 RepID=A0A1I0Y1N3_9PSEU|nr:glycosyltransferase family 9 protein [Amycolatopsis marina]SFB06530.1 ADP-heptose:LPS heptosyltransferase [Amycolatopsis marina]